jgi:hypothetical protein
MGPGATRTKLVRSEGRAWRRAASPSASRPFLQCFLTSSGWSVARHPWRLAASQSELRSPCRAKYCRTVDRSRPDRRDISPAPLPIEHGADLMQRAAP